MTAYVEVNGEMHIVRTVPLHSRKYPGVVAIVDPEDYDLVSQYRWNPFKDHRRDVFYASSGFGRDWISMHKLITGYAITDHEDHDGLNNCRYNLRDATKQQNGANRLKTLKPTSSQYKGVCWDKRAGKWRSTIVVDNRSTHLGLFDNEHDAALVYNNAAIKHFGEFACCLNSVDVNTVAMAA
jgi:hypothetical protein